MLVLIKKILKKTFHPTILRITFSNFIINLLPDIEICSYLRVCIARLLGLTAGSNTSIRKTVYLGNLKNIKMGAKVKINRDVFFDAFDKITIGSNVGIAFQVSFVTSTHEIGETKARVGNIVGKPITIEDGCWIGARAIIGPGVTIGKSSVIAAGAVVLRSMPSNSVIAGNPARVINRITNNNTIEA